MSKETLEEAAERLYPISKGGSMWMPSADDCNKANKQEGFIEGAKWQAERMYSEEQVIAIVEKSRATGLTAEYIMLSAKQGGEECRS
jgi:hypothetical protein